MFVDVKIGFTNTELKECQELLAYLSNKPSIKAEVSTDALIEEAHKVPAGQDETKQDKHVEGAATVTEKAAAPVTLQDVRQKAKAYMDQHGAEAFTAILAQLGAKKLSEVKEADYAQLVGALENAG